MTHSNSGHCGAEKGILDPVSEFYNDHPYPPPVQRLDRARDEWQDENRPRSEFHLLWPDKPHRLDLEILVAGCGTWQAAKYAICRPGARVTGIDFSRASIDHTETLKRQHNLTNLETYLIPIEKVVDLNRQFDLIVCTGVLHHLLDPDRGIRALRSVLKPDGAIYLMVYAPYGRAGAYLLQDYCRRLAIGTSLQEINDLKTAVDALPPQHPLVTLLSSSRDAQNSDAMADALLNPRDRSYSVPELIDLMERNGLTFGRWYWQAPYLPQCGAIAATPHAKRLLEMAEHERYAAMELWRGMMSSHSVIVYRSDGNTAGVEIALDGDRWQSFVPLHLATIMCVQERLPSGAAGVLLNRSHRFHDLILVINALEKKMFDAIDGRRSIAEIIHCTGSECSPHIRAFFKKLWWYDQVAFDTSGTERARICR